MPDYVFPGGALFCREQAKRFGRPDLASPAADEPAFRAAAKMVGQAAAAPNPELVLLAAKNRMLALAIAVEAGMAMLREVSVNIGVEGFDPSFLPKPTSGKAPNSSPARPRQPNPTSE